MSSHAPNASSDTAPKPVVGWVGAGKMGTPMIRHLIARGTHVSVTEPSMSRLEPLLSDGASEAPSLADHGSADIVFSTLPNDQILRDVVFGSNSQPGLADVLSDTAIFVEMSTVSPEVSVAVTDALKNRNIRYLRAPLSGSTALAEQAALTILASGDKTAWNAVLPYLELMSTQQFYLGQAEEARYMKLVLNTLVGATSAILSEALALGESGGLQRSDMMQVICESAVSSPLLKYKTDAVVAGNFDPAFSVNQMIKDFSLISDAGRAQNLPLFTTGLILELYRAAANAGLKDEDFFALVKWYSGMSPR